MTSDTSLAALAAAGQAPAAKPEPFPFVVAPPLISFLTQNVQPPAPCYVTPQDRLLLSVWNSGTNITLRVDLRMLMPNGQITQNQWTATPSSDRTLNYWYFNLAEGMLLALTVSTQSAAQPGTCYAKAYLIRGQSTIEPIGQMLLFGYVVTGGALAWPYPRWTLPAEGPGRLRSIVGTQPAAGQPILETVPTGARWGLRTLRCTLTTNTTAVTRYVEFYLHDGTNSYVFYMAPFGQAQSLVWDYNWGIAIQASTSPALPIVALPLPDQIYLPAGYTFGVYVYVGAGGDQLSAPKYSVEEWIAP